MSIGFNFLAIAPIEIVLGFAITGEITEIAKGYEEKLCFLIELIKK